MGYLGATAVAAQPQTSASAIIAQICTSGVGKGNCPSPNPSNSTAFLTQAIQSRFLPPYTTATGLSNPNACAGVPTTSTAQTALSIGKTSASAGIGIAGSIATAVGAGTAALPIIGTIAGLVTGVIAMIVGHHSAAVKEQDTLLCQAIPATNNVLAQIDSALASGSITPAQAEAQYSSFLSQFASEMKSDPSYNAGDAMGGYLVAMQCVIAARNQDLQNGVLTGGAPGPWTQTSTASGTVSSAVSSLESSLGVSSSTAGWLPWAVAGGIALLLLL